MIYNYIFTYTYVNVGKYTIQWKIWKVPPDFCYIEKLSVSGVLGLVPLSEELSELVSENSGWFYQSGMPKRNIFFWLFQLDDSKSLLRKWLCNQTSILNW